MSDRLPPLTALRAFEAAARHLSFRIAARELSVTPAAVSHQIKALEAYLGVPLFKRLTRALEMTEPAQRMLPKLRQGFDCFEEAIALLRDLEEKAALDVTVAPSFAVKWLAPRLHRFLAAHPDIDVNILSVSRVVELRRAKTRGTRGGEDADLAIRFGSGDYPGHRVDRLFPAALTPLCAPALLERHPLRVPQDLGAHALLHDDTVFPDGSRPRWELWLEAAGAPEVDTSRGMRFNRSLLALEAAADGAGVVLSIAALAQSDIAAGRLVAPFPLAVQTPYAYFIVVPEAAASQPRIAAFRDWLLSEARQDKLR